MQMLNSNLTLNLCPPFIPPSTTTTTKQRQHKNNGTRTKPHTKSSIELAQARLFPPALIRISTISIFTIVTTFTPLFLFLFPALPPPYRNDRQIRGFLGKDMPKHINDA